MLLAAALRNPAAAPLLEERNLRKVTTRPIVPRANLQHTVYETTSIQEKESNPPGEGVGGVRRGLNVLLVQAIGLLACRKYPGRVGHSGGIPRLLRKVEQMHSH